MDRAGTWMLHSMNLTGVVIVATSQLPYDTIVFVCFCLSLGPLFDGIAELQAYLSRRRDDHELR